MKQVGNDAKAEGEQLGLSEREVNQHINLTTLRALGDKYKDSPIGKNAREAHAMGNYFKDACQFVSEKHNFPMPGRSNPYNQQGRDEYSTNSTINEPQIQQQIKMRQIMQVLALLPLFGSFGLGMAGFMGLAWMR